jgi:hypothetical protein
VVGKRLAGSEQGCASLQQRKRRERGRKNYAEGQQGVVLKNACDAREFGGQAWSEKRRGGGWRQKQVKRGAVKGCGEEQQEINMGNRVRIGCGFLKKPGGRRPVSVASPLPFVQGFWYSQEGCAPGARQVF